MPELIPAVPLSATTDRARNELRFFLDSAENVLEPRRERGELQDAHGDVVRRAIAEIRKSVLDGFLGWFAQARLDLTPRGLVTALPREAGKARAELDSIEIFIDKLTHDGAIARSNAWSRRADGRRIVDATPAAFDAGREMRLREIRDHFKDDKPQVVRRALVEAAANGDDETVEAFATGPKVTRDEHLDEPTMKKLGDIYVKRAGKQAEVESAEMAASLGNWVLGRARAAIDAVAGAVPADLVTPDGRRVARAQTRASDPALDFASRLLRIDSQGNAVPLIER